MGNKDYVKIQKNITNERIKVIEGAFIGAMIGLLALGVTLIVV